MPSRYENERRAMNELAKRQIDMEKLTRSVHQEASARIQRKIDDYYIKYASNNGLTRAEAMKQASQLDVQKYSQAARLAVETKDFSDDTNKWLKTYNLNMKVNRLELLKAEIELELATLYNDEYKLWDKALHDELIREYRRQSGIMGKSVGEPSKRLKAVVNADFYGNSFSDKVWGRTGHFASTRKEVFKVLSQIYTDMDGFKKQRDYLMQRMKVTENEAVRLIRTEMGRINNQARLVMGEEEGFTHYQYICESNPCPDCSGLDGRIFKLKEASMGKGGTYPLLHPNCLCSTILIIEMTYQSGRSNLQDYTDDYAKAG